MWNSAVKESCRMICNARWFANYVLLVVCIMMLGAVVAKTAEVREETPRRQKQQQQQRRQWRRFLQGGQPLHASNWYTRYASYPEYCGTPAVMESRKIPEMQDDPRVGESRLVHVAVAIRHGQRTPWSDQLQCWEGYWENSETGVWNCNLTTITTPPSPDRISPQYRQPAQVKDEDGSAMFLFEKHYDALMDPADGLANSLNGTCQMGQLLLQGYEQQVVNGRHLRDAYVYDGKKSYNHDARLRLLDVSSQADDDDDSNVVWKPSNVYFRSDDEQRTLMSGQVVMRGLFGPELDAYFASRKRYPVVPLHTADYDVDVLYPDDRKCPRLKEMRERFERSAPYQAFLASPEAQQLRSFERDVLGIPEDKDMDEIDCLMTTMCTDRPLPDAVHDYTGETVKHDWDDDDNNNNNRKNNRRLEGGGGGTEKKEPPPQQEEGNKKDYGKNLFQRLYDYEVKRESMLFRENDGEYSKLGIGPLWREIMANIDAVAENLPEVCCPARPRSKLALFSGHDTTLMPLLATLGPKTVFDGSWAGYASMMAIEVHEVNIDGQTDLHVYKSNFAFRLIYNGQVRTHLVEGCPSNAQLCDLTILRDLVRPFAHSRDPRECARLHPEQVTYVDTVSRAWAILSTTGGVIALAVVVLGSACLGAVVTFFFLTGSLPQSNKHASVLDEDEQDGIALTSTSARSNGGGSGAGGYSDDRSETTLSNGNGLPQSTAPADHDDSNNSGNRQSSPQSAENAIAFATLA